MKISLMNIFLGYAVLCLFIGVVCAEDTYLESLQKINQKIDSAEKNIIKDIDSFNGAFKDTFKLIDDEISRLIIANAAMVGGVFAIMFLVYAKTTSRSRRDIQVLLTAHAKHIDNLITTRMEELESKIDDKFRARDTNTLMKLGDEFDSIAKDVFKDSEGKEITEEIPKEISGSTSLASANSERKRPLRRFTESSYIEEAKLDIDGKAKILKESNAGNRVLKRLKRGLLRLLGKNKVKKDVVEFKK